MIGAPKPLPCKRKKRPANLELKPDEKEDDLKRMVRLSTIFQSEAFQNDTKKKGKPKKNVSFKMNSLKKPRWVLMTL